MCNIFLVYLLTKLETFCPLVKSIRFFTLGAD